MGPRAFHRPGQSALRLGARKWTCWSRDWRELLPMGARDHSQRNRFAHRRHLPASRDSVCMVARRRPADRAFSPRWIRRCRGSDRINAGALTIPQFRHGEECRDVAIHSFLGGLTCLFVDCRVRPAKRDRPRNDKSALSNAPSSDKISALALTRAPTLRFADPLC